MFHQVDGLIRDAIASGIAFIIKNPFADDEPTKRRGEKVSGYKKCRLEEQKS